MQKADMFNNHTLKRSNFGRCAYLQQT